MNDPNYKWPRANFWVETFYQDVDNVAEALEGITGFHISLRWCLFFLLNIE